MHLLEDSFDKGPWDDSGFMCLAIFPVYVVQQNCAIIHIRIPFMEPTPRIFHQFGNSDAMFIRLLQSLPVSQFNLTQWEIVLILHQLGFCLWRHPHPSGGCYAFSWSQRVTRINNQVPCFCGLVCAPPEYSCLEALGTSCPA